jgi:hypothetical protein
MAYSCKLCPVTRSSEYHLRGHMKKTHENMCDLCDFDYYKGGQKGLEDHILAVHLNVKQYKCEECEYAS